ncbi:MAG: NUDIX domain-containing protein [Candidatus Methylomirabilales bacterium]
MTSQGFRGDRFCPRCGGALADCYVDAEGRNRLVCDRCAFILYQNPKVVAGALPVVEGQVVLLRREIEPARGRWTFPAGFVEMGETVVEAAIRETREEVALEIGDLNLLNVYAYAESPVVTVVYVARVRGGAPRPCHEALEVGLFAPSQLPWQDLAFRSTREALSEWRAVRAREASLAGDGWGLRPRGEAG